MPLATIGPVTAPRASLPTSQSLPRAFNLATLTVIGSLALTIITNCNPISLMALFLTVTTRFYLRRKLDQNVAPQMRQDETLFTFICWARIKEAQRPSDPPLQDQAHSPMEPPQNLPPTAQPSSTFSNPLPLPIPSVATSAEQTPSSLLEAGLSASAQLQAAIPVAAAGPSSSRSDAAPNENAQRRSRPGSPFIPPFASYPAVRLGCAPETSPDNFVTFKHSPGLGLASAIAVPSAFHPHLSPALGIASSAGRQGTPSPAAGLGGGILVPPTSRRASFYQDTAPIDLSLSRLPPAQQGGQAPDRPSPPLSGATSTATSAALPPLQPRSQASLPLDATPQVATSSNLPSAQSTGQASNRASPQMASLAPTQSAFLQRPELVQHALSPNVFAAYNRALIKAKQIERSQSVDLTHRQEPSENLPTAISSIAAPAAQRMAAVAPLAPLDVPPPVSSQSPSPVPSPEASPTTQRRRKSWMDNLLGTGKKSPIDLLGARGRSASDASQRGAP